MSVPTDRPLALVLARAGELPPGAEEAASEAGGATLVLGDGAEAAAGTLRCAEAVWWADTGPGLRPGALATALAPVLAEVPLVVLPGSPDGRDLAPRLAAGLDRTLLAGVAQVCLSAGRISADLARLDDRVLVAVEADAPAIATLSAAAGSLRPVLESPQPQRIALALGAALDVEILEVIEPDPSTMDLSEASMVFSGGAGLAAGLDHDAARAAFELLGSVAAELGASEGATRVATDAGWISYERQIGTTGVGVSPQLYVALGVSGASQHVGGLGEPEHTVSVNLDPSCPMTAMADLGIVADARALLVELAGRLEIEVPDGL